MDNILKTTQTVIASWENFTVSTPTKQGNTFSGKIARIQNCWYGALAILEYNGQPCEVLVPGMPKLHYPYINKAMDIYFDPNCQYVINTKLDGTNIAFYSLFGEVLRKTRLNPVLKPSKFGDFNDMIERFVDPGVVQRMEQATLDTGYTLCAELWGQGNLHSVYYDESITLTFLTAIKPNGQALSYNAYDKLAKTYNLPVPEVLWSGSGKDILDAYVALRKQCEQKNVAAGKFIIEGGIVHGGNIMWKCKPDTIEELHMTGNRRVPDQFIEMAIMKVMESYGDAELYTSGSTRVVDILLEDFTEDRVLKSLSAIDEYIKFFQYRQKTRERVAENMEGMMFDNIPDAMRHLSQFFEKRQMKVVYTVVKEMIRNYINEIPTGD